MCNGEVVSGIRLIRPAALQAAFSSPWSDHKDCALCCVERIPVKMKSSSFLGRGLKSEVQDMSSTTVIRAYTVSCLLLSAVLLWSVGDAWCHYAQSCDVNTLGDGFADFILLRSNL